MAAPNNNATVKTGTLAVVAPKSQRGHNKPKCKQCGNVARSRCPYESCKSCCSRNQNPCHIHGLRRGHRCKSFIMVSLGVLLGHLLPLTIGLSSISSTLLIGVSIGLLLTDKTPSSGAAPLDQQSLEQPQLTTAGRVASLRQLSNSFAQFNNLHISLRSKKPLTRKDAAAINEWRFSKLKEYKERSIEVENEAFDRYMQNVDLLEEVLSVKSSDDNVSSASESNPTPENNEIMMLQLRSNSSRSDGARMRIQQIVDAGLKELQKRAVDGDINESLDEEANEASKRGKRTERLSTISDLMDKINKARSEEDLKSCLEMKFQLFNSDEGSDMIEPKDNEMHKNQSAESDVEPAKELDYSLPKLVGTTEIDQETLNTVDKHFSSLEHVEEL